MLRPYHLISLSALAALSLTLSACAGAKTETLADRDKQTMYKHGSALGGEGGWSLFGRKKREEDGSGLGVNSFLWRASLDTLAFMPIASADPFGGVILTDWYTPPNAANERLKVNVYILDRQLRADGVRVSVFRQLRESGGQWKDAAVTGDTANQLEETILTRARQLRVAQNAPQ